MFDFACVFVSVVGIEWPSVVNNRTLVKDATVRMIMGSILKMRVGKVVVPEGMRMIRIVAGRMGIQMGMFVDVRIQKWGGMKMRVWQVSM